MPRYSASDSSRSAKRLALRYVSTGEPGYARRRCGRGFAFLKPGGKLIGRPGLRERLSALPIPPAWTQVWICRHRNGHILATGRDAKGRKVYLYHPDWRRHRSLTNFDRLLAFGRALPAIRRRVDADLRRHGLSRERVLAAAIRLMDVSQMRVGSDEYARDNRSFGVSTLLDRHLKLDGKRVRLKYRGKGGQLRDLSLTDRRLARVLRQCEELPGQRLFQFLDEEGSRCSIASEDINAYLQEAAGETYTAKDFRTWGGTVAAVEHLMEEADGDVEAAITRCIEHAAARLGNTETIAREHYVHPLILDAFRNGGLPPAPRRRRHRLVPAESVVLKILRRKQRPPRRALH